MKISTSQLANTSFVNDKAAKWLLEFQTFLGVRVGWGWGVGHGAWGMGVGVGWGWGYCYTLSLFGLVDVLVNFHPFSTLKFTCCQAIFVICTLNDEISGYFYYNWLRTET